YVDEFIDFPGHPAFPEQGVRASLLDDFYRDMQEIRFDLALQMHGSGVQSNDIIRRLGARHWGGFVPDPSAQTSWLLAWPDSEPEIIRYLALLQHLGLSDCQDPTLEFPLQESDHERANTLVSRFNINLE